MKKITEKEIIAANKKIEERSEKLAAKKRKKRAQKRKAMKAINDCLDTCPRFCYKKDNTKQPHTCPKTCPTLEELSVLYKKLDSFSTTFDTTRKVSYNNFAKIKINKKFTRFFGGNKNE